MCCSVSVCCDNAVWWFCVLQTFTVVAEVEKSDSDSESPAETSVVEETDVNVACSEIPAEESASAADEASDVSLSELERVLPELPPRLPQVPPRPAVSRPRPTCSQSFSAAPPRPPAIRPKLMHRTQSSATSSLPPVVPPRPPRRATTIHNDHPTLFSLQQPATVPSSSTIVQRHAPQFIHAVPDASTLGSTFNYVYFTEDAVPPAPQLEVTKSRKHQQPPDVSRFVGRHTNVGKKLAESGLGAFNAPGYSRSDDSNPAGSYVRLAVTTPPPAVDSVTSHDYCYPSIDSVVIGPAESVCRIEPQRSPPPLPTKSRRVGWWDCRWRRPRARNSQLRATWSPRLTTYGTEQTVVASVSLNNSQSSSLNTRRPPAAWRSRLVGFVRTCIHPCRWRRRWWQRRRLGPGRGHVSATWHLLTVSPSRTADVMLATHQLDWSEEVLIEELVKEPSL